MTVQSGRHQATHAAGGREASRAKAGESAAGAAASPAFVGRDDAFARVAEALDHGPALVLIEGEAGIGKTRLLQEVLAARTRQRGSTGSALQKDSARRQDGAARPDSPTRQESIVLVAACPPLREPFPLGPVVEGIRRFRDRLDDAELSDLGLSKLCGALRPLFPEWADDLPPALEPSGDPKETRHRLLRALAELVECLGVEVLAVEDAHWADTATLEWLLGLTTASEPGLSVVVTYRPTDVPEDSLLLGLTSRVPSGMAHLRVELEPLDVEQTRGLVASMLDTGEVSEKFAAFLQERTDGVPLAVEETIRMLQARQDLVREDGSWRRRVLDELEIPPTVRDSVLERVGRMDAQVRAVLEAAAVVAEPAAEELLIVVAELDDQTGRRAVAGALSSGLLHETDPGRFVFRHALDAQAIAEAIPASDWRRLHGRAAQALGAIKPEPVVRLARHFREAGHIEAWCNYAEASAELALESGDDRNAIVTLLEMLESVEHPMGRRVRLVRKLGEAFHVGTAPTAEFARQVAESLSAVVTCGEIGRDERGELRLLLGRALWRAGQEQSGFQEIEAATPDLSHRPDLAIRAMLNLARPASSPDWPAERHLHWLACAAALAKTAGSPADRREFTQSRTKILLQLGMQEAWESINSLNERPSASPTEQRVMAGGASSTAIATLPWGRYDLSRQLLDDAVAFLEAMDYERVLNAARVFVAFLDWYTGAWDGLAETAKALAESDDTEPPSARRLARQLHSVLMIVTGSRTLGEPALRQGTEDVGRQLVADPEALLAPAMLARLLIDDGAMDEALGFTSPAVGIIAKKGVWLWATDIAPVHMDILTQSGSMAEAASFISEFAAGIDGRDAPAPAASLIVCRAIVAAGAGEPGEGAALFADAAPAWAALPRPYDELLARERQGNCLLVAGERLEGLEVLADAERRLRELGARWDADRLAHLLRQHGIEVSRAWKRGRRGYGEQLSPREKEVLALVARGMTNREVGRVLFLSPKTVGGHLSSAMRKLGVSSRTAAAIAATEAGLISAEG